MNKNKKLKNNYELLVEKFERKLDRISNNRKLYNKLKKLFGVIAIIVLFFGLWPVTLISILLAAFCAYEEKEKYEEYCKLVDKLEGYNENYSNYLEEKDRKKNRIKEVQDMINEPLEYDKNICHGERNGYKIYSKR